MTTEPAPPDGKEWTQVKSTPKRGSQKDKGNEQGQMHIESTKWRAEFVVNRSDRGKQWLIDVALTNLLQPFFQQESETKIICEDNTVIKEPKDIKGEINKNLKNVATTTETRDRKIVVFNIYFPQGLTGAKRNKVLMDHLKERKVFLNEHTCDSLTFAQVGFLINLDPNTAFRPDVLDRIQAALTDHIMTNPKDGKHAFEPTTVEASVPFIELRKGIEMAKYKPDEDNPNKVTVKTEALQVWTETQYAEKLRALMSKADLEQKSVGQFIPKQRGALLISPEKYVNAINCQNKYVAETSSIMIQCIASEAMSAGVFTTDHNTPVRALDEHILNIENVKRIEQTNDTESKGKWLIVCKKSERENIRELLIEHLSDVYRRSSVYDNVKDLFHSPVPIVAPPRYDYKTYIERIIPENMILNDDSKPKFNPKTATKRLPTTITTTLNHSEKTSSSPYLEAVKRSSKRENKSPKTETTYEIDSKSTDVSRSLGGSGLRSNDSALSALTSKVDSLTSKLTAANKEIEAAKKIIAELRQENTEIKNMHNKTEAMFQQMMLGQQQLMQSINPMLQHFQNTHNHSPFTNMNATTQHAQQPPELASHQIISTPHEPHDNQPRNESARHPPNFFSARTSLSTAARTRPLREPPDLRPTNLFQQNNNETNNLMDDNDGNTEIVFSRCPASDTHDMSEAYIEDNNQNNFASPSSRLEDEY